MKMHLRILLLALCIFYTQKLKAQWQQVNGPYIGSSTIVRAEGNNVFAGTSQGIFLSTNEGTSWAAVNNGLTDLNIDALSLSNGNLFVETGNGIFHSTNNGSDWSIDTTGIGSKNVTSFAINGNNIFAGTFGNGVFYSDNNGSDWTAENNGLTNLDVNTLAIDNNNILAGTATGGIYLSTNNGSNWNSINNGLTNLYVISFGIYGNEIFSGTSQGGAFLSTDSGENWVSVNNGLTSNIQSFSFFQNKIFAGTGGYGVFLSTNNASSWNAANEGLAYQYILTTAVSANYIFAGTQFGGLWRRQLSEFISAVTELNNQQPIEFSLSQNFPEPFNPTTTIRYSIRNNGMVTLKVYDLLGKEVITLVNENQKAGDYSIKVNASNLSSGVYIYRLESGQYISSKKMILIK